jgi:CMP-2-keto-3-deoxyoctulosonic acid synthetase
MNWKDLLRLPPPKLLTAGLVAGVIGVVVMTAGYHASGSPKLCGACHSMGFHNPTMVMNTLGRSIDLAHQAIGTAEKASGGR